MPAIAEEFLFKDSMEVICIYIYTFVCVYIYIYTFICMYVYIYIYIHAYTANTNDLLEKKNEFLDSYPDTVASGKSFTMISYRRPASASGTSRYHYGDLQWSNCLGLGVLDLAYTCLHICVYTYTIYIYGYVYVYIYKYMYMYNVLRRLDD